MTTNKVTIEQIEGSIVREQYYVFPNTTVTVCALTVRDGFTATGKSACADPDNFDAELGKRYARERAIDELWSHFGSVLCNKLYEEKGNA